ncbi:S-layer homology domain-containing protein [Lysinibacillus sp. SGAir0095]|uniref:S-layer homology domain-containing protein n=1 Tax=Lysinibacillus sp. SGAir0095 TaxID=2070463 RepID=UPI0010CCDD7C|nr:S-layer homology domain-containing protein [Lysinibacillus sp. SGAir0095]QCR31453.1 hypothetical protein C1N55_04415 [Lysinibacillus sp. SGAir0095]
MANQPKKYKKFVATAATATLVASAIVPVASAATPSFPDIAGNDHASAIEAIAALGYISGKADGTFAPNEQVTRSQVVYILGNWAVDAGLKVPADYKTVQRFKDVPLTADDKFLQFTALLKDYGIFNGSNGNLNGGDKFQRQHMAVVLNSANKAITGTSLVDLAGDTSDVTIGDLDKVVADYRDDVLALKKLGITSPANFNPSGIVTRGQFATFLNATINAEAPEAKVASVNAINATQVVVKFTQAVDPATLFANDVNGAFEANTVSLTSIEATPVVPGTIAGELSADGKTLTITTQYPVEKRYNVVVENLSTTAGKALNKYDEVVSFTADKTAPSIVSTVKPTAGTVTVKFSEPMKSLGTVSFKLADGTVVADNSGNGVLYTFNAGDQEVTFTLGSDVPANATVTAQFIGAQDQNGNLLSPNPATTSLLKGAADGVAPTVTSIAQTGATTFAVKFSEELTGKPTITVAGSPVAAANVVQDKNDKTKYNVTAGVLDGATTIAVSSFTDLSGVAGTTTSRVVTFVKDAAAPKVVSSAVVADSTTKVEYLELTFDKDVVITGTPTVDGVGSFVKDYVTTSIETNNLSATAVDYKVSTNKKVIRVQLDTFLGTTFDVEGAAYNLTLSFADVKSAASVLAEDVVVKFTRGKDGVAANTDVVTVSNIAKGSDNSKVAVTFDKAVDGASATNPANYKIDGAIVESVTLQPAVTGATTTQVAIVNLKANSNGFTGTRNINISGVKALGSSKVMTPFFTNTLELAENVLPTVTSAKLTETNKVTLTFSEAVVNAAQSTNDFELYIGGVKVATNDEVTTALQAAPGSTTLVLTLEDDITASDISKGLVLKAVSTIDIQDSATNVLSVPTAGITVTQ